MGWFWADPVPSSRPAHNSSIKGDTPPPGCPMHQPSTPPTNTSSGCPYVPPDAPYPSSATSTTTITTTTTTVSKPNNSRSSLSRLNPLNYMPFDLSNKRAAHQKTSLPLSRETSTILKEDGSLWEYPSPQQMYNAMLRKGYNDTPEDAVESMVAVHNFLNEGAWAEIREWERRFSGGLSRGWHMCSRGEEGVEDESRLPQEYRKPFQEPRLVRFIGRPGEMTPKARVFQALGWAYPSKFASEPPFDRHDWFVQRNTSDGGSREVRYVIDYYSGPPDPTGEEVFFLDVRPAVDTPTAAIERAMRWGGDFWWRASGGIAREIQKEQTKNQSR